MLKTDKRDLSIVFCAFASLLFIIFMFASAISEAEHFESCEKYGMKHKSASVYEKKGRIILECER